MDLDHDALIDEFRATVSMPLASTEVVNHVYAVFLFQLDLTVMLIAYFLSTCFSLTRILSGFQWKPQFSLTRVFLQGHRTSMLVGHYKLYVLFDVI